MNKAFAGNRTTDLSVTHRACRPLHHERVRRRREKYFIIGTVKNWQTVVDSKNNYYNSNAECKGRIIVSNYLRFLF
ncbi:hypothetical protein X975_13659, partial [Stegodyphus mimosarum]